MIIRIGKNGIVYKGIWRLYFTGISKIFAHDGTIGGIIPIPIRFEKKYNNQNRDYWESRGGGG